MKQKQTSSRVLQYRVERTCSRMNCGYVIAKYPNKLQRGNLSEYRRLILYLGVTTDAKFCQRTRNHFRRKLLEFYSRQKIYKYISCEFWQATI